MESLFGIAMFGRDEAIQVWCLIWILAGVFLNYIRIKRFPTSSKITAWGLFKKLIIGFVAWGLFLTVYGGIENMGHIKVILPALSWGLAAEIIVGGLIQQKIQGYTNSYRLKRMKKVVVNEKETPEKEGADGGEVETMNKEKEVAEKMNNGETLSVDEMRKRMGVE